MGLFSTSTGPQLV